MASPLIATKLYIPRLRRGLVARPRLLDLMRRGADRRVTLVSAPAGFGKTTLLAEWLRQVPMVERRVAWVSLDRLDNAPAPFWTCVVTALHGAVPALGASSSELIVSGAVPTDLIVATLINELTAEHDDVWLILDDLHLIDDSEVGRGVADLLDRLPDHVHVVLCTRADPDLPLSRWRVRGELVEIRAADLRFTADEAATYLNDVSGLTLTAEDVVVLETRTEGWIAALQLAALSMQGRQDTSTFVSQFAGDNRYLVDYLVEEVLAHQPEPVRDFLLQSAHLDRLSGPLCDVVLDRDDSGRTLVALERANLFLVALDDKREWYRYHHLFADVLRARLFADQPDLVVRLHQRASRWYQAHGATDQAISHALAARELDRAVYLLEMSVPAMRRDRSEGVFGPWLAALPEHAVLSSPVLTVFSGYMLMVSGDLAAAEQRFDVAESTLTTHSEAAAALWAKTDELRTLPATIAVYRASLAQARGDLAGTAEHAQRAVDLAGPDDHLARGAGAGFLGLTAWSQGDIGVALATFAEASASLYAAGNLVDALRSTVILADMWLAAGRPATARRLFLEALRTCQERAGSALHAAPDLLVGLGELDVEAGDFEAASRHLEEVAEGGDWHVMTDGRYRWFVASGRLAEMRGDRATAIALLDEAERLYRPGFFPDVRPAAAMRARVWIGEGDLSRAQDWATGSGVSSADAPEYLREFDHLTLVRLSIAQHRMQTDPGALPGALGLLDRLGVSAESTGRAGSLVEIRMLQALVHDARGHRPRAHEALGRAFSEVPEPKEYAWLFLAEGAPMVDLLRDARHHGVAGGHPARLLELLGVDDLPVVDSGRSTQRPLVDALSERELQVLRLLDSDLSGPQIARELFVSHNTVRTHTKHIFTKLDVTTRRAAVSRGHERGLM